MPRLCLVRSDIHPYHVTARSNNKMFFSLPMENLWKIFVRECFYSTHAFKIRIHSFVLMSNHFHMLVTTPLNNLDEVMYYFMKHTSAQINEYTGAINHVYGGRYKWSLITRPDYYLHAYKYVYQNPLRAKLCSSVENYNYSTISGLTGKTKLDIPIKSPHSSISYLVPSNIDLKLEWLNQLYDSAQNEALSKAFLRTNFEICYHDRNRRPIF